MNLKINLLTFTLLSYWIVSSEGTDLQDANKPGEQGPKQTMAFEKDQLYMDFFPLSKDNFTETVVHSRLPWVVFFHDGMLERSWKLSAVNFRGIIRFGMIDRKEQPELVKELKLVKNTTVRFYPYGGKVIKKKYFEDLNDGIEAIGKAEKSIPDKVPKIEEKGRVDEILLDSYMSKPSRFPAFVLTRESSTPTLFRAISLRFQRYFNFYLLKDPSVQKMRQFGLPSDFFYHVPGIVILIAENFEDSAKRRFFAVQYDKSSMGGELNYPNLVMFLIQVNRQFRHSLPGENESHDEDIVKANDILVAEREMFDIKEEYFSQKAKTRRAAPVPVDKKSSDPYLKSSHSEEL